MEKEFIPYELALRMKQLGFDEPCFGIFMKEKLCNYVSPLGIANSDSITALTTSYSDLIPQAQKDWVVAPLYQQAFRWFREKHNVYPVFSSPIEGVVKFHIPNVGGNSYSSYEEAEQACLEKLIEIVEQKQK
jgi:hypothetical protein